MSSTIGERQAPRQPFSDTGQLLKLRVLRLGFLKDGDVGIGVFPEGK
jgi:hypothetical protein